MSIESVITPILIVFFLLLTLVLTKFNRYQIKKQWKGFRALWANDLKSHEADLEYISAIAIKAAARFGVIVLLLTALFSVPVLIFILVFFHYFPDSFFKAFFSPNEVSWEGLLLYVIGWCVQVYTMFFTLYTSHEFQVPSALLAKTHLSKSFETILTNATTLPVMCGAGNLLIFWILHFIWSELSIDWDSSDSELEEQVESVKLIFICYAAANMYFYLFFRVFAQLFRRSAFLSQEELARSDANGIEEDHPKNPATFVAHLGEGYVRIIQENLEYVALGSVAYVTIYFFYLSTDFARWASVSLHAPLAVVAVCFFFKSVFLFFLRRVAIKGVTADGLDLKRFQRWELYHSILDNFVVLVVFIVLVFTLIPDYVLSNSEYVSESGQIASFVLSLLFVFVTKIFQSYFAYPHHRPTQFLSRSADRSLSFTLMNASNLSGLETMVGMVIYPVFLLVVYIFFESQGVCYFLLAFFVSYMTVKGLELVSPVASATEVLIQSSHLNAEMNATQGYKKVSFASRLLGELYAGISYYMVFTMVILIILFTQGDVMDDVTLTSYKMIFCFLLMALFVVIGKALNGSIQMSLTKGFSQSIRFSMEHDRFIQEPSKDPPIYELTRRLGNRALRFSILLYLCILAWFLFWGLVSIVSDDVDEIQIGCLLALLMFSYFTSTFQLISGQNLVRLKEFISISGEHKSPGIVDSSYISMLGSFVGKTQVYESANCMINMLLVFAISYLLTYQIY